MFTEQRQDTSLPFPRDSNLNNIHSPFLNTTTSNLEDRERGRARDKGRGRDKTKDAVSHFGSGKKDNRASPKPPRKTAGVGYSRCGIQQVDLGEGAVTHYGLRQGKGDPSQKDTLHSASGE